MSVNLCIEVFSYVLLTSLCTICHPDETHFYPLIILYPFLVRSIDESLYCRHMQTGNVEEIIFVQNKHGKIETRMKKKTE